MKNLFISLLTLMACSGCSHYYYAPNAHNVPLFEEKNEFRLAGSGSNGDEFSGLEAQAAYSVTDHFALMGNFMSAKGEENNNPSHGDGHYIEGGAGYFTKLDKKIVFEVYGGFGGGRARNYYSEGGNSNMNFLKGFVQPAVGFTSPYFDAAVSMRLGLLNYNRNNIGSVGPMSEEDARDLNYIHSNPTSFLWEPAITVRGGWKYIKLQTQLGFSQNLSHSSLAMEKTNFNIGLYISLGRKFGKG
jgi:hypothetical protein